MDGILNILKPPGMTSFDVVAYLRGLLGIRKIGHAGTLDPMAAGVLPVCTGKATKAIEFLMDKDKLYRTELLLGITTDTQDSTGRILSEVKPVCSDDEIIAAVRSFTGRYAQTPPMHSALRVDGKRLYELARAGVEVERRPRTIEIYSTDVVNIDRTDGLRVMIDVHCSKGTYIRTLCADIGIRLGCGGHMTFLLRKRAGSFDISESLTLEEIERKKDEGTLNTALQGVDKAFAAMPYITLDEGLEKRFKNGMRVLVPVSLFCSAFGDGVQVCVKGMENNSPTRIDIPAGGLGYENLPHDGLVRVYGADGSFAAIGEVRPDSGGLLLKAKKFFWFC